MQTFILGLRYFFLDLIGGVVRWPVWWYTRGLLFVAKGGGAWIRAYAKSLALKVWVKNLFVPMYGMYDWQSRMISFFMRLAQIVARAIGVFLLSLLVIVVVLIYVIAPPLTIAMFFYQFVELYA